MADDPASDERTALTGQLVQQMSEAARLARDQWTLFARDLDVVASGVAEETGRLGRTDPLIRKDEQALIASMAGLAIAAADLGEKMFEALMDIKDVKDAAAKYEGLARSYGRWVLDRAVGADAEFGPVRPPRRLTFEPSESYRAVVVYNDAAVLVRVDTNSPPGYSVVLPDDAQREPGEYVLQAGERMTVRVFAGEPDNGLGLLVIEMRPVAGGAPVRQIPVVLEYRPAAAPDPDPERGRGPGPESSGA